MSQEIAAFVLAYGESACTINLLILPNAGMPNGYLTLEIKSGLTNLEAL